MTPECRVDPDTLEWSGKSVFRPSDGCPSRGSFNLDMLADDAGLEVWSLCRGRAHTEEECGVGVSFDFEPPDANLASLAAPLVDAPRHRHTSFASSAVDFAKMLARWIVAEREAVYELQIGRNPESKQIVRVMFRPVSVPGGRVLRFGNRALQVIPKLVAEQFKTTRFIFLEPNDTFVFRAPTKWRRRLARARSVLKICDSLEKSYRGRFIQSLDAPGETPDYVGHRAANVKMIARATAPLGWYGRGLFREYHTDYQLMEWQIRWKSFCRDLVRAVVEQLQRAVRRLAELTGSSSRLVLRMSPDDEWFQQMRERLRRGEVSFAQMLDALH